VLITSVTVGVHREVMEKIMARGHSRIPVYDEDKRNLVGVLLVICIPIHCNLVLKRLDGFEILPGLGPSVDFFIRCRFCANVGLAQSSRVAHIRCRRLERPPSAESKIRKSTFEAYSQL